MPADERLVQVPIEDEMRSSYLDYAMSVIVGRALPDVRDGLKPVHRRILYGMNEMGLVHNRAYRKSAKIVGEIMGNYHPHGDAANIPTHNLAEVVDGLIRLIENPDTTVEELMESIPGPDFPTAGYIYGTQGIKEAYTTGRGLLTLRAKASIETDERTDRDRI